MTVHALTPKEPEPPPLDIELEQTVLGSVLIYPASADRLIGYLRPDHFYDPIHARLWEVIESVHAAGDEPSFPNVIPRAAAIPGLETVGGRDYITRLAGAILIPRPDHVINEARLLIEMAARREVMLACERALQDMRDLALPFDQAVDACETAIGAARLALAPAHGPAMLGAACASVVRDLMGPAGTAHQVTTGLADLDDILGGLWPGNLTVIGGRPGMGKTAMGVALALAAGQRGEGVGYFSLEMTNAELAQRAMSALAYDQCRVAYQDIRRRQVADNALGVLMAVQAKADHMPIMLSDLAAQTIAGIRAGARRMTRDLERRGTPMRLLILDHLTLVRDSGRWRDNRVATVGEVSSGLKALAKEIDIPVVALCQLNRGVEGREDKRPQLPDLRESGSIEQDADQVVMLYREEYYLRRQIRAGLPPEKDADIQSDLARCANTCDLIVAKNRHGAEKSVTVFCDIACNVFRDLARRTR